MAIDDDLPALADLGEIAGVLAHEFNNVLNQLVLQAAVLERTVPAAAADLGDLRRAATRVGGLVRLFQDSRGRKPPVVEAVDLNEIVRTVANGARLQLAEHLPPVAGAPGDVRRLVRFLIANACRAASVLGGSAMAITSAGATGPVLAVEEPTPAVPTREQLLYAFEPTREARPGTNPLELAACAQLARRMGAKLRAEVRPTGRANVVEFPAG